MVPSKTEHVEKKQHVDKPPTVSDENKTENFADTIETANGNSNQIAV